MSQLTFSFGIGMLASVTTAASDVIDSSTHIPLGAALSVASVVVPAAWYISGKFRSLEDQLASIKSHLKALPCKGRECISHAAKPLDLPLDAD